MNWISHERNEELHGITIIKISNTEQLSEMFKGEEMKCRCFRPLFCTVKAWANEVKSFWKLAPEQYRTRDLLL